MKQFVAVFGIVATAAVLYEPKLLIVAAALGLIGLFVFGIGVATHD